MCLRPRPCSAFSGCLPSYKYRLLGQDSIGEWWIVQIQSSFVSLQSPYSLLCLFFLSFLACESNCMLADCILLYSFVVMSSTSSVAAWSQEQAAWHWWNPWGRYWARTRKNKLSQNMFKRIYGRNYHWQIWHYFALFELILQHVSTWE